MAVSLDGIDDILLVADSASLTPSGSISCGAWVNADAWTTSAGYARGILSKYMDGNKSWALVAASAVGGTSKLQFYCAETINAPSISVQGTTNIAARTGEWLHIAAVYVPSTSITVYLNGVADGSNTTSIPAAVANNTATLAVGSHWHRNEMYNHDGLIADAWMINAALTPAQIAEIASVRRLPLHYFTSAMKLYLPLMGPTGVAVNTTHWGTRDLSGNGNSVASPNSAPVWADDPLPPQAWVDGWFGGAWAGAVAAAGRAYFGTRNLGAQLLRRTGL